MLYIVGAIIIFMLVLMSFNSRVSEDTLLKGFWRADAEFCTQAELEMFVLYLGDNVSYLRHRRNGYLLAANEYGIILNNPIELSLSGNINLVPGIAKVKNYDGFIDWQESPPEDENAFPDEFQVAYYPQCGKLVLHKDNEVLVSLWKDCHMSAMTSDVDLVPDCIADCDGDSRDDSNIRNNEKIYEDL